MMASCLLSRLSHAKHTAFSLPRTLIFARSRPSNGAKFIMNKWVAPTRAFCNIADGDHSGTTKSCVSVMESQRDKVVGNVVDARSVLSLLNKERVEDVRAFPPEILGSEECLLELFEVWIVENDRCYPSHEDKMRRFDAFKDSVYDVHKINTSQNSWYANLNMFADYLPGDSFFGGLPYKSGN